MLASGLRHAVYMNGNRVLKVPIGGKGITFERAQRSVNFFLNNLSEFSADTQVLPIDEQSYIVDQEYIPGPTLGEYLQENPNMSAKVRKLLESFSMRAMEIYRDQGITFDILGNGEGIIQEVSWKSCANIIVTPEEKLAFVDTVDYSNSLLQSKKVNQLLQTLLPGRKKRVTLLKKLSADLGIF